MGIKVKYKTLRENKAIETKLQEDIKDYYKKRIEEENRRNKNSQYYLSLYENAKKTYFQEQELFISVENMYEKALISKYDYLSSKFYLQELYFDYVEKYLNYYSFLLSCF